jgi:monoamine oxidase
MQAGTPKEDSSSRDHKRRVAVVGGGISGLTAAKRLIDQGCEVDIYDAARRMGGKVQTVRTEGLLADAGAEFIDSRHTQLLDLCKELGVKVVRAQASNESRYYLPSGEILTEDAFNKAYLPLSQQIQEDKQRIAADPTGELAQKLDGMSMSQYLHQLADRANTDDRPLWKKILLFWTKKPGVSPEIVTMAEQTYTSEAGRPAANVSALQFVRESGDTQNFLESDCQYRVEGGTQRLIEALENYIRDRGGRFHLEARATEISKGQDQKFHINFEKQPEGLQEFDQVVLSTHAHALAAIKGLDALGLSAEAQDTLQQMQYTHGTKFTIKTKVPVKNDGFFFSSAGYQTWNRAPDEMVFLIGDDLPNQYKPKELMNLVMNDYAMAHGTTAEAMFDTNQVNYNGPNVQAPCYASPAPGQALHAAKLRQVVDEMAQQGVGVVGSYIQPDNGTIGFMGGGVESSTRATDLLAQQQLGISSPQLEQQMNLTPSFVDRLNKEPRGGWARG